MTRTAEVVEELARALSSSLQIDAPTSPDMGAGWDTFAAHSRALYNRAQMLSPDLVFQTPPESPEQHYRHDQATLLPLRWLVSAPISAMPNTGLFALKPSNLSTKSFIAVESTLWTLVKEIDCLDPEPPDQVRLDVARTAESLDGIKRQAWDSILRGLAEEVIAGGAGVPIFRNGRCKPDISRIFNGGR